MHKLGKPRTSKGLATLCAKIADNKLAEDIVVLDLTKIEVAPAYYFVICSCTTDLQSMAIVEEILKYCKLFKLQPPKIEGIENRIWILLDFFDVVVHIFLPEARHYYNLEKLWGDAIFLKLTTEGQLKPFHKKLLKYELEKV